MNRLVLLLAALCVAACGPTETKQTGAITNVAQDAQKARSAAQDAAAAAEATARRIEEQSKPRTE